MLYQKQCFNLPCKISTEAEYAYRTNKEVIPVKVERDYKADGWLGILLGTKLWCDFSKPDKQVAAYEQLVGLLGEKGKIVRANKENNSIMAQEISGNHNIQYCDKSSYVEDWTEKEVKEFLSDCGLRKYLNQYVLLT